MLTFSLQHLLYNIFAVLHKDTPLKTIKIRQNQVLLMTKALRRAIMTKSALNASTVNDHLDKTWQLSEK